MNRLRLVERLVPFLLALCQICFGMAESGGHVVAGAVVHALSRTPIKGAHVMLTDTSDRQRLIAEATTGADGRFQFETLKAGKFTLSVERLGFSIQSYNQKRLRQQFSSAVVTGEGRKAMDSYSGSFPML